MSNRTYVPAAEIAKLIRLKFQGDDGYGQGTVGMPGDRMTGKGYPQTVGA